MMGAETAAGTERGTDGAILADLVSAGADVLEVARRHGMTIGELAHWAAREEHAAALRAVCELYVAVAAVCAARGRACAVVALAAIGEEGGETARRACVDLLGAGVGSCAAPVRERGGAGRRGEGGWVGEEIAAHAAAASAADSAALLEVIGAIGRAAALACAQGNALAASAGAAAGVEA